MSDSQGKKLLSTLLLFALVSFRTFSQVIDRPSLRLVFYNAENFFDIYDDSVKQDNDFLPHGIMRWNAERYKNKVNSIYKVLAAAGKWEAPAIAGFCEIEKRSVLYDLFNKTYLVKYDYGIIHEESEDVRGIDVCLLYRKDLLRLIGFIYLKPFLIKKEDFKTRRVLYSKWLIQKDTLHLFLNHWPSRRGGALSEESLRESIAEMVKQKADSILNKSGGEAKIIIAGDFNCSPDDPEVTILTGKSGRALQNDKKSLINLSFKFADKGFGTYKYQGRWEMLDQIIVSQCLINSKKGIYTDKDSFSIFSPDFLLEKDPSYPGLMPYSTYRGYRYHGGFSDHLPVMLDLYYR